jgi:hypothetical protein
VCLLGAPPTGGTPGLLKAHKNLRVLSALNWGLFVLMKAYKSLWGLFASAGEAGGCVCCCYCRRFGHTPRTATRCARARKQGRVPTEPVPVPVPGGSPVLLPISHSCGMAVHCACACFNGLWALGSGAGTWAPADGAALVPLPVDRCPALGRGLARAMRYVHAAYRGRGSVAGRGEAPQELAKRSPDPDLSLKLASFYELLTAQLGCRRCCCFCRRCW